MRKLPPGHRLRWMRALLLALPLLSLPILYAALGAARSSSPSPVPSAPWWQQRQQGHRRPPEPPPRLAYLITAAGPGDAPRIRRLLRALYHPWNCYLVGVADEGDRADLEAFVRAQEAPRRHGNVRVALAGEWGPVSRRGPTELAATLHAAAVLLREFEGWSWFINLSASDYPLMPQDDILHIFSYIPRDLNFIEHTSNIGWKEYQRARPIIVDPALQVPNKTEVITTKEKRSLPSAFKIFVGTVCYLYRIHVRLIKWPAPVEQESLRCCSVSLLSSMPSSRILSSKLVIIVGCDGIYKINSVVGLSNFHSERLWAALMIETPIMSDI